MMVIENSFDGNWHDRHTVVQTLADSLGVGSLGHLAVTFHATGLRTLLHQKTIQKVTFW